MKLTLFGIDIGIVFIVCWVNQKGWMPTDNAGLMSFSKLSPTIATSAALIFNWLRIAFRNAGVPFDRPKFSLQK